MKNIILLVTLTIIVMACQKKNPPRQEPELKAVAEQVLNEAAKRGKFYSLDWIGFEYANLEVLTGNPNTLGLCHRVSVGEGTILVDHTFWMYRNEYREQLIAHELGHCLLGKGHEDAVLDNSIQKSVMSTYIIDSRIFSKYRTYYFDQLFN